MAYSSYCKFIPNWLLMDMRLFPTVIILNFPLFLQIVLLNNDLFFWNLIYLIIKTNTLLTIAFKSHTSLLSPGGSRMQRNRLSTLAVLKSWYIFQMPTYYSMVHSNKVGKLVSESFLPRLYTVIFATLPKHCFEFLFIRRRTKVTEKELLYFQK